MRALISVYDRTGLIELAQALTDAGWDIVSSGGTGKTLQDAGIPVTQVADVTEFPEMLDGRVKTLHPRIHAGILADRTKPDHLKTIEEHGIAPIDLVVSNLYPFDKRVTDDTPSDEAIELIDVGGPSMVRAAAKNHESVAVVVDPDDYSTIVEEIRAGGITADTRRRLAGKAFATLSAYDGAIAQWFAQDQLPERLNESADRLEVLRYGENPHQRAAAYRLGGGLRGVASAEQLQGKELSFINYLDLDAAFRLATAFEEPAACIVKHTSPCGAATADDIDEAYRLAFECDTRSAFGGIIGLNRAMTRGVVDQIREADLFVECIVAPEFEPDALELLRKRKNLRLMKLPVEQWTLDRREIRSISGGLLVQEIDAVRDDRTKMQVPTKRQPSESEWDDLLFAWTVCARVKSNSIVVANARQAVGIGAGQMSRVEAFEIAVKRAGDRAKGSVAASEALLPFADNVEVGAQAGVTAIIQPGGSARDDEVVAAADAAGLAMVFTGVRHFWH
ncbi:MAG TPA: bifunctional phosphoribosylaminoimidazolecarboxamide formyltransferase/IMP cyclohydrolase [Actinomycetota bacterium]|jgi:phosphoribosylaminoimidazolecarboxamide formyltransferase/IMP cyclohydrolase|nr:bifunctional phosphoribosylaminoimidazolecarboxamide formyltransferase/IMP cyclohydrolase [Actinomycetota bacterium]